jgi:hypothetical protein
MSPPTSNTTGINLEAAISSNSPNIPFSSRHTTEANTTAIRYNVVVYYEGDNHVASLSTAADDTTLKLLATEALLTHYFPEFYPFIVGENTSAISHLESIFLALRDEINNSLSATFTKRVTGALFPSALKIIFSTFVNFYDKRHELYLEAELPSFDAALTLFNTKQGYGAPHTTKNFDITATANTTDAMSDIFENLGELYSHANPPLNYTFDFGSMQVGFRAAMRVILDVVYNTIDLRGNQADPTDEDYITIYFDDQNNIVKMEYFMIEENQGNTMTSKIGYFTNIKYNSTFRDPMLRNMLMNYDSIMNEAGERSGLNQQTSIIDFFENYGAQANLDSPGDFTEWGVPFGPDTGGGPPYNNIFAPRSFDRPLDFDDFEELKSTIKSFVKFDEVVAINNLTNDPDFRRRMFAMEKAKRINAAIQVTNIFDKVVNFNLPLAGPNKTKEAKMINQILQQFGITQLIKEAIMCFASGAVASMTRVSAAVRNALMEADLYAPPSMPSDELSLDGLKPPLGAFKIYFSISGDPPLGKQILNIIFNALANAGFEIIKGISEIIQTACGELFDASTGDIDISVELEQAHAQLDIPNLDDILNTQYRAAGFDSLSQGYEYLAEVSQILNVIEVCRLLNSTGDVTTETIERIVVFNQAYEVQNIRRTMTTRNQILAFFQSISRYVDTTTMCNELINNYVVPAVADCEICLDENIFTPGPAIENLIDLLENGPQIEIPDIDFLCPNSEYFVPNPVIERIIPRLFYTMVESIDVFFASSLEASRTALLSPTLSTASSDMLEMLEAMGLWPPQTGDPNGEDPVEPDPDIIKDIIDIFEDLESGLQHVENFVDSCPDVDTSRLPGFDEIGIIVEALQEGLAVSSDSIENFKDSITNLHDNLSNNGAPITPGSVTVELAFPTEYKNRFDQAIGQIIFNPDARPLPARADVRTARHVLSDVSPWDQPAIQALQAAGLSGSTSDKRIAGSVFKHDHVSSLYEEGRIQFDFLRNKENYDITIEYPLLKAPGDPQFNFIYNLTRDRLGTGLEADMVGTIENFVDPLHDPRLEVGPPIDHQLNEYIYRFLQQEDPNLNSPGWPTKVQADFPMVYLNMIDRVFNYILNNGSFSEAKINALNLFKNNIHCDGPNVGDLLDADGILEQLKQEFARSACEDERAGLNTESIKEKTRNALRFGIINLLIQALIIRFFIKNIVAFSAFSMQDILSPNYPFKDMIVEIIISEFEDLPHNGTPAFKKALEEYFIRLSSRPTAADAGGIAHSYTPNVVVSGFEAPDYPSIGTVRPMIRFMVEERLGFTWSDASSPDSNLPNNRSCATAITSVIGARKKSYADAFLYDIVGIYTGFGKMGDVRADIWPGKFGIVKEIIIEGEEETIKDPNDPSGLQKMLVTPEHHLTVDYFVEHFEMLQEKELFGFKTVEDPGEGDYSSSSGGDKHISFKKIKTAYSLYYWPPTAKEAQGVPGLEHYGSTAQYRKLIKAFIHILRGEPVPLGYPTPPIGGQFGWENMTAESMVDAMIIGYTGDLPSNMFGELSNDGSTITPMVPADQRPQRLLTVPALSLSPAPIENYNELPPEILYFMGCSDGRPPRPNNKDYAFIKNSAAFNTFFNQVLNRHAALMVPILYNTYLAGKYCPELAGAFDSTISAIVGLMDTVEKTNSPPELQPRGVSVTNPTNSSFDIAGMFREIILKFLRETPIHILRGLAEILDPHVVVCKIVRQISAIPLDIIARAITQAIQGPLGDPDTVPPGPLAPLKAHNTRGEDIMNLAFCAYNLGNTKISDAVGGDDGNIEDIPFEMGPDSPRIGPWIDFKGVDFLGSVSGMFMMPPFIFGILYLLLRLLLSKIDEGDYGSATPQLSMEPSAGMLSSGMEGACGDSDSVDAQGDPACVDIPATTDVCAEDE